MRLRHARRPVSLARFGICPRHRTERTPRKLRRPLRCLEVVGPRVLPLWSAREEEEEEQEAALEDDEGAENEGGEQEAVATGK
eukprot:10879745-Alexandrium_andersonii.AAC.1